MTLQDVFDSGCVSFYEYLAEKEVKLAHTDNVKTSFLKQIKEDLSTILDRSLKKFMTILKEAG